MLEFNASIVVIFILVLLLNFILNRIFFKPVRRIIDERQSKLRQNRDFYQKTLQENEARVNEIEEKIRAVKKAASQRKGESVKQALEDRKHIIEEIQAATRVQIEEARKKLEREVERSKKKLAKEAETLAWRIEERLLHS